MDVNALMKQDMDAREDIVLNTSENFFVEAGAGSGKTTMLVRRMVAMVEAGIDVSRISAITFTKAAAGEFYDRFQKLLAKRSTEPTHETYVRNPGDLKNPTDETRKRCKNALLNIDLCFMGTIDSFCNMVLSEHPTKADIPSNSGIVDDDKVKTIYLREYSRIFNGKYGDVLQAECRSFNRLLGKNTKNAFVSGVSSLMDIRHTDIVEPDNIENFDEYIKDEREELLYVVNVLSTCPEAAYDKNKESRGAWEKINEIRADLDVDFEENITDVLGALKVLLHLRVNTDWWAGYSGKLSIYEDFFVPHESRGKIAWYEINPEKIKVIKQKLEGYRASLCLKFLKKATDVIAKECRKRGELTFFDYLLYLRDMLKRDAEGDGKLIKHIYSRHSFFLIDEFQDTNPMQAEVFFYLTAKNPVPDWRKCVPNPGSLFIVGDPKQSIYRFRNADVASFLKVKGMFVGDVGRVLLLTRNFRSTYKMRNWFNETFRRLLSTETEEQSRFSEIPLEKEPEDDGTFGGVYYYNTRSGKDVPEEEKDENVVSTIISQLVNNPSYLYFDGKGKTAVKRMFTYKDFMLITPSKGVLSKYMKAFVRDGIPFYVEGETLFMECPALVEIIKIFDVIARPNDKHVLYKALIGKTFGFHRNHIAKCLETEIVSDGKTVRFDLDVFADNSLFTKENGSDCENLANTLAALKDLIRHSYKLSSSALFYLILNDFDVLKKAGAGNLEYVWFALELLRAEEYNGNISSLKEGADYLNGLISNKSGLERCISLKPENNRVHLANLHKVKGLEAPVVILASPKSKDHEAGRRTVQCEPWPKSYIFSVSKPYEKGDGATTKYFETDAFEEEKQLETQSSAMEKLRLLYVAATRAKSALLVSNGIKADGGVALGNPWAEFVDASEGDFFDLDKGKVSDKPMQEQVDVSEVIDGAKVLEVDGSEKKATYKLVRPSMIKSKGKSEQDTTDDKPEHTESETVKGREDGALIGTMVHRVMEVLVSSGNTADASSLVKETVNDYAFEYPEKKEHYEKLLLEVLFTIRNGGFSQENGPSDILNELLTSEEVLCEVPFCYKGPGHDGLLELNNGVIDVLYRKDDKWHIVDYKTNAESEGLLEKYEEQLQAYVIALRVTTGKNADARIYHINV